MTKKIRNFVHKASVEINKPRTFRDRKKEYKRREKFEAFEHDLEPEHQPYSRNGKQNKNKRFADDYEEQVEDEEQENDEE